MHAQLRFPDRVNLEQDAPAGHGLGILGVEDAIKHAGYLTYIPHVVRRASATLTVRMHRGCS